MNFITWNCRGVGAKGFPMLIKDLCREYEASLVFLLETHASGQMAQQRVKKMGFSGSFIVDSQGQSGGIWCLWNAKSWKVDILESNQQLVHLHVTWKEQDSWLITSVYASPNYVRRQQLWEDLERIADSLNEPSVVLGDFNSIVVDNERRGGSQNHSTHGISPFRDMIQACDLLDAGFQGSKFSWRHGNLFQRLDRVLINMRWRMKFQHATVFHMPFFKSNHRVVWVQVKRKRKINRERRPFRFLAP